jgi:23S rRNA pseudouridine1911/1915/1917 synthase
MSEPILHTFTITSSMDLLRLDKYLVQHLFSFSRSHIEQWIQAQKITVNGKWVKPSYRLKLSDVIEVYAWEPIPTTILAEPIPFGIAYEDEDILVVNKPQGLVVHPAPGHYSGTLVNGLLHYHTTWSGINGVMRPGIVHRIDKDTSGLLIVAKHDDAHRFLADQLKNHLIKREYIALVHGVIQEDKGSIIAPIGRDPDDRQAMDVQADGKEATTHFHVIKRYSKHTLISCNLETGRTHQIRVHMQYIHHPIESDPVYAKGFLALHEKGQLLHAFKLSFIHPITQKEQIVEAELPDYFSKILDQLA